MFSSFQIKRRNIEMKLDCFRKLLSSVFLIIGEKISQHPCSFIFLSIISSVLFSLGILKIKFNRDTDYLLSADSGKVYYNKHFIDKTFRMNTSLFVDELRYTKRPKALVLYFIRKENEDIIEKSDFLEIKIINDIVINTTVSWEGKIIQYLDICGRVYEKCHENPILHLISNLDGFVSGKIKFKYPLDIDPLTYTYRSFALNFGGVNTDHNGYIEKIKAIRLVYFVDESDFSKTIWIREWKNAVHRNIKKYKLKHIKILLDPFFAVEKDMEAFSHKVKSIILACIAVVSAVSMITLITNNWTKSKPWLGIASVISAGFAVGSGFGLLSFCGIDNTDWNIGIPFLILVTETDDAYFLIACWRITNDQDTVKNRMGNAFSEAGVSITITSITNMFSYAVGLLSPFPIIRTYCMYASVCMLFSFIYQISFFGGCLALSGYREKNNHPVCCFKRKFTTTRNSEEYYLMKILSDKIENIISHPIGKIIIVLIYFINLGFGISGFLSLKDGLDAQKLYPEHSEISESFRIYYKYFIKYPYSIQIIFNQTLDYSDSNIQISIENFLADLQKHPHIADSNFYISWLKYYKEFQKSPLAQYSLKGYDMSKKQDFIDGLQDVFLKFKAAKQFSNDINFDENSTDIINSRMFVLAENISDQEIDEKLMIDLEKIVENAPFDIIVHHMFSSLIEQGIIIREITGKLFWITGILIFIIIIIFIPNIMYVVVITLCVSSIMINTIGYMNTMKINLDIVSLMFLVLSIGFCVNYPIHMSFSLLSISNKTLKERLKISLYNICFPIFQGSLSTVLGIMVLLYNNIYISLTLIKIVSLSTFQTAFHAMFVIPVFLSFIISLYK